MEPPGKLTFTQAYKLAEHLRTSPVTPPNHVVNKDGLVTLLDLPFVPWAPKADISHMFHVIEGCEEKFASV